MDKYSIMAVALATALLLCLFPMPYGFYELVRFAAAVIFAILAWWEYKRRENGLAVTFGALALLFQPYLKIALGRTLWNILDVLAAVTLIILVWRKKI